MGRILFWVALFVIVYAVIVLGRTKRVPPAEREKSPRGRRRNEPETVKMIECPVCGTHFPANEAVLGNGISYCSEKCRNEAREAARKKD